MKKRVVFILSFLLALLVSVGAAIWIIVYQTQSPYPTELSGTFALEFSYGDDLLTAQNGQLKGDLVKKGLATTTTPTTLVVKHTTPDGTVYSYPIHQAATTALTNTELVYGVAAKQEDGTVALTANNSLLTAQTSGTTAVAVKVLLSENHDANTATQKFLRALLALPAPNTTEAEGAAATFSYDDGLLFNVTTDNRVTAVYQNNAEVAMPAVAYNGSNYYGTIDGAINAHSSGTTYVIPGNTTINPYILKDCTVKNTLALPIEGTTTSARVAGGTGNSYLSPATYCKTKVTLCGALTVNKTITIGGTYNAAYGGRLTSQTCGNYAQITLNGGTITANNGATINCYGFIKGSSTYTDIKFLSGSTLFTPFVLYEFRGGSVSSAMQKSEGVFHTCPILRFIIPNIDGAYQIQYGATVTGNASLTATGAGQTLSEDKSATVVGTGSTALIQLQANSYLNVLYNASDRVSQVNDLFGSLSLKFYGGANLHALDLSVSILFGAIKFAFTSEGTFFPISYLFDIELNSGTYAFTGQDVKILPGGSITVNQDAILNADNIICYTTSPPQGAASEFAYPSASTVGTGKLTVNGKLNVSAGLAGEVLTDSSAAEIVCVSNTLIEKDVMNQTTSDINNPDTSISSQYSVYDSSTGIGGSNTVVYYTLTEKTLALNDYNNASNTLSAAGSYYSGKRSDGTFGWYSTTFKITYDENGGSAVEDTNVSLTKAGGYTLTQTILSGKVTTREHYTFSHWCTQDNCPNGSTCANKASGRTVYGDTTIYATWKKNQYKLNYVYVVPDGDGVKEIDSGITPTEFTIDTTAIALNNSPTAPTYTYIDEETGEEKTKSYNFSGWFTAAQNGDPIDGIVVEDYRDLAFANGGASGELTIYAVWIKDIVYTVHFENSHNEDAGGYDITNSTTVTLDDEGNGTLTAPEKATDGTTLLTAHNDNPNDRMYFDGWYVDENFKTAYTNFAQLQALVPADGENYERTLYAKWVEKQNTISFVTTYPSGTTGSPTATTLGNVYLYTGQTLNLATNINDKMTTHDANSAVNKYFNGWTAVGATISETTVTPTATSATLTVNWATKATLSFSTAYPTDKTGSPTAPTLSTIYVKPNTAFTIPTSITNTMTSDADETNTAVNYYFNGWTATGSTNITKVEGTDNNVITVSSGATSATLATNWTKKWQLTLTLKQDLNGYNQYKTIITIFNSTYNSSSHNGKIFWINPKAQSTISFTAQYTKTGFFGAGSTSTSNCNTSKVTTSVGTISGGTNGQFTLTMTGDATLTINFG